MRFSDFVTVSLAAAPLVAAHGDAGAPKIFGMPKHLKTREFLSGQKNVATPARSPRLQSRQGGTAEGRCGANFGGASCAAGYCCSAEGYCGNTGEHCAAPDCQINYGPGCDANQTPAGSSTRNDARPQLGNIEYGGLGIRSCLKPKTVAITYDDGPYIYTTEVMDMFKQYNAKATFFITGNNIGKGAIDQSWRGVIQDMYARGHQIASHTWSHQNLDQITSAQRYDQMVKNEMALRNIIGKYPTYMRPPYSACDSAACQADLKALGYVITSFDLDTDDYNQLTTEKIETAKANFKKGVDSALPNGDQLAIAHDIHELTARTLTPYMLKYVYDNGFTAVTVGECMGDPEANWYRDSTPAPPTSSSSASASSSAPVPTPTGPTTTNGACGTANPDGKGQSCIGFVGAEGLSECCSQYGYCGRSENYCQTGCNPLFGKCGTQPSVVPSASASVTATSSAPVPTVSLPTSTDAQCGAAAGFTCKGFTIDGVKAECCSQYNYCGNTEAYCGTGCNPLYGNCGVSVSSSIASSSASARASSSAVVSSSASSSAPVSSKVSSSAVSSKVPTSSVVSSVASSSAPASSKASSTASVSASASVSKSSSASASPSVSNKASSSAASASASVSKSESASVKPSSASASPSVSKPASSASATPSNSKPASSGVTSYSATIPQVSSTPAPVSSKPASSSAQPSSKPASSSPAPSSGGVYPGGSTISTVVKPSSTPCTTSSSASPTPTKPVTSKDGKCGQDNGGQTCAGYKNGFGWKVECCCKESGRCSTDPWACGVGCDKAFGNCWWPYNK